MSTVKLQGNTSGSGSVTLVSPNLSSDITVTLPNTTTTLSGVSTTAGDVGTYGFFRTFSGSITYSGGTTSGSNIRPCSVSMGGGNTYGSAPSGTWRSMGYVSLSNGGNQGATVYVRIS